MIDITWYPITGLVCFLLGIGFGLWIVGERAIAEAEPVEEQEEDKQPQWERDANEVAQQAWRKWR